MKSLKEENQRIVIAQSLPSAISAELLYCVVHLNYCPPLTSIHDVLPLQLLPGLASGNTRSDKWLRIIIYNWEGLRGTKIIIHRKIGEPNHTLNIQPYIPTTGGYQVHPMYSSSQQNQLRLSSAIDARSSALAGNFTFPCSSLISNSCLDICVHSRVKGVFV